MTEKKHRNKNNAILAALSDIYNILKSANILVVGRTVSKDPPELWQIKDPTTPWQSKDPATLWLSNETIDAWEVRYHKRNSDTFVNPRGMHGAPQIKQPYHKQKRYEGDLPKVECWPIKLSDFFRAVDERLKDSVSELIKLKCPIPHEWKTISYYYYVYGDHASEAWDDLRFWIRNPEALSHYNDDTLFLEEKIPKNPVVASEENKEILTLDADERKVLGYLNQSFPKEKTQTDLETETFISRKTIGQRILPQLKKHGLAKIPEGKKRGIVITKLGIDYLKNHR